MHVCFYCDIVHFVKLNRVSGVGGIVVSAPVKRETGENPVRTRHRIRGVSSLFYATGMYPGKVKEQALIRKPGDLPDTGTGRLYQNHEILVVRVLTRVPRVICRVFGLYATSRIFVSFSGKA